MMVVRVVATHDASLLTVQINTVVLQCYPSRRWGNGCPIFGTGHTYTGVTYLVTQWLTCGSIEVDSLTAKVQGPGKQRLKRTANRILKPQNAGAYATSH